MTTLVIVPTYNERENVPPLVDALVAHERVNVLIVDDNSPDGTGAVADDLAARHPGRVSALHRTADRGFGRSYIDGIRRALREPVDVIAQMDADFSHDPVRLPALVAAAEGADVVIGSRYTRGGGIRNWSAQRRLLSRFANVYVRAVTGLRARDCTSGFRCWRRDALAALPLDQFVSDGYSFLVEMLFVAAQQGQRIAEVPITYVERREGESKMSRGVILESAVTPWRLVATRGRVRAIV
ncbi:MAG TPA: polyprenol monophosphomannose synthase [Vicinamibacterales bacterium]|nr:polyprenol monophosphomannose synthase [Vicinamibacterales bacterium]